jgi:hypothetical protein
MIDGPCAVLATGSTSSREGAQDGGPNFWNGAVRSRQEIPMWSAGIRCGGRAVAGVGGVRCQDLTLREGHST